jgi:hypothetical protein
MNYLSQACISLDRRLAVSNAALAYAEATIRLTHIRDGNLDVGPDDVWQAINHQANMLEDLENNCRMAAVEYIEAA